MPKYKRIAIFGLDKLVDIKGLGIISLASLTDRGIGLSLQEFKINTPYPNVYTK
ncbi:MAG: hypothetical protein QXJ56_01200 [Ignisphaera sp.]